MNGEVHVKRYEMDRSVAKSHVESNRMRAPKTHGRRHRGIRNRLVAQWRQVRRQRELQAFNRARKPMQIRAVACVKTFVVARRNATLVVCRLQKLFSQ